MRIDLEKLNKDKETIDRLKESVQIRLKRIQERQNKVSIKEAKGLFLAIRIFI